MRRGRWVAGALMVSCLGGCVTDPARLAANITSFQAAPTSIVLGDSTLLSWTV